ncbi:nuclease-related domain-containing protein [Sandarakinorhabdus oryzae]|uniref:nuclease-related domain-containing protein n=1 Tax=Sandarakinorhabdus oryzae TaxID=2675220 RepID=UPI0012E1C718|nr:nuclease-related domain-containing protein [Sandarakinorhabdus oryzae]
MILKHREDRSTSIATLEQLMAHPAATRHDIERLRQQIDAIIKGDMSENKAAIELETHWGHSANHVIIHDLRIELDGLVAQIDHLLINRLLDVWVLESKRLGGGIKVQDNGECLTFSNGRYPVAIDSPIEQNRRHVKMLERLFDSGAVPLPRRMGLTLKPRLRSLVLIAEGRISRPSKPVPGIESLVRTDQMFAHIQRGVENGNPFDLAKLVSADTVKALGEQLVAMHRPIEFDWERRFQLAGPRAIPKATTLPVAPSPTPLPAQKAKVVPIRSPETPAHPKPPAGQCDACQAPISSGVKNYCRKNPERFGHLTLCMDCQGKFTAQAS